jgi:DNA-binding XRE family transcriptional regulator
MNVGQAMRLCRAQWGASQGTVARRANCSVSYLSMVENYKLDAALSTQTSIAQVRQIPVGLLFLLASEQDDLGPIDEKATGKLLRSALASLAKPTGTTTLMGDRHG